MRRARRKGRRQRERERERDPVTRTIFMAWGRGECPSKSYFQRQMASLTTISPSRVIIYFLSLMAKLLMTEFISYAAE